MTDLKTETSSAPLSRLGVGDVSIARYTYKLLITLSLSLSILSCVGEVTQVKLDAYMGSIMAGEALPELEPIVESQILTFNSRSGLMGVSLADQRLLTLCEASEGKLSDDSDRMICIPESRSTPLTFVERLTGSVIMALNEWNVSEKAPPSISYEGSVFASLLEIPDELDHIGVYNDFGINVARLKTSRMYGFVGPDHLIVDRPPQIWAFREGAVEMTSGDLAPLTTLEEAEELGQLSPVGSRDFIRHDYEPYGVLYEERDIVYFLGVDQRAARKVGDGQLVGVSERRVLILNREGTFGTNLSLSLFELGLEMGGEPLYTMELDDIPGNAQYHAELIGIHGALLQTVKVQTCGGEDVQYALRSYYVDLKTGAQKTIYDANEPHKVAVGLASRRSVISYVDNCGRSMGSADIFDLIEGEKRSLPSELRGKVRDAAVSAKGDYIAIMGDEKVWLLDGSSLDFRVAHAGEPMVGDLRFRK